MSTLSLNVALDRPGFSLRAAAELTLAGITALFGPSGSGKTTLLRIIAGLEGEASGSVTFDGEMWQSGARRVPTHRRHIGYVFQDGRLFSHLTVEQNLAFARTRGAVGPRASIDLEETIEALDLRSLLTRRTPSLSGGEQQRVAIARALLRSPRLLLMDEPLSSLDIKRKREILPHIEALPEIFGVPVLYVTHNLDEVARLANDVVLLADGRIAAHGSVAEVFERTDLGSLTGGLEAGVVLRARVAAHDDGVATLRVGTQQLRVPMVTADVGSIRPIRIHARDVAIATVRPEKLSIRNILSGRIKLIAVGNNMNVELLLDVDGEHLRARITRDALEELDLAVGREVFALIKSVALESSLG
ncbi:MAG TPA: molybdenum ABC transporter ATP-binding protein, partial [Gammaproteobacteria bacterium]|nr:molybdenum ABC transporter ATP-binding protein [Gammaproteobacteria bacterium]